MTTTTDRREPDEQLVELTRDVAGEPEPEELVAECPYCGGPLDEDLYCPFDGATALGGLPEPR